MNDNILILDDFGGFGIGGKLYFARYNNNNPALFLVDNELTVNEYTMDIPEFFREYPFGEYSLILIPGLKAAMNLIECGIVNEPAFHINHEDKEISVCELTGQVVDLLKEQGKYYV